MRNAKGMLSAREAALKVLGMYRRNKAWSDIALDNVLRNVELPKVDAALASRIVYGVLQNMTLCDFYGAHYSTIELKKLEPRVHDILRLSIYQILFLSKIPNTAAVNEGVALVKKYSNSRAAGYLNAVLRKISKAADDGTLPEVTGSEINRLSTVYSHPQWLVEELVGTLDELSAEAFLIENNKADIPVTAQVNTLITNTDDIITALKSEGVEGSRHEFLEDCIDLHSAGNISHLGVYKKGMIYIQDAASRLAIMAASPKAGDFIIDGCAAPGGKSFSLAMMMKNSGRILACDIHASKLRHIETGTARLGISIIETIQRDAQEKATEQADMVIADVPCSGLGIIRKKPEIRYKSMLDIKGLPELQLKILNSLSEQVKPTGTLLYSTCTILKRENEDVVRMFLKENSNFKPEPFVLPGIGHVPDGMITLWPHINKTDGFFICKMKRV